MAEDRTGVVARLDALEAAHKAATPGPWTRDGTMVVAVDYWIVADCWEDAADAAAIVAEHNALPALVAVARGVLDRHHRIHSDTGNQIDYCDYDGFVWPCAEYRDLAAALGKA